MGVRGELDFDFEGSLGIAEAGCKGCLSELGFADVVATEMAESLGRLVMVVAVTSIEVQFVCGRNGLCFRC